MSQLRHSAAALRVRCFQRGLAVVIALSVVERWAVLRALYSDEGVYSVAAFVAETSPLHRLACAHAWSGAVAWQQALSLAQLFLAWSMWRGGARPRRAAAASLYLYASVTVRHVRLAYILDRYVLVELLFAACYGGSNKGADVVALWLWRFQLTWIYADAGLAKLGDPDKGWSAAPLGAALPALDAYTRHSLVADLLRSALGARGLRLLTPSVPWLELMAPFAAHCAAWWSRRSHAAASGRVAVCAERLAVATVLSLHLGIGLIMNGAALLSLAAAVAWLPLMAPSELLALGGGTPVPHAADDDANDEDDTASASSSQLSAASKRQTPVFQASRLWGVAALSAYAYGAYCFELSKQCVEARRAPFATLFHNRWNVFAGSDDHVVWEIIAARLEDGGVVDLWNWRQPLSWHAPPRAARRGRWRSFPMLGQDDADEAELDATYSWFCRESSAGASPVTHFKAYMLRADLLNTSNVAKRLLHAQTCATAPA